MQIDDNNRQLINAAFPISAGFEPDLNVTSERYEQSPKTSSSKLSIQAGIKIDLSVKQPENAGPPTPVKLKFVRDSVACSHARSIESVSIP
jgi:hypothetical protein